MRSFSGTRPSTLPSFEDHLFPLGASPLLVDEFCGERRIVALALPNPFTVCIYEHSEGPITLSAFCGPWHASLLTLEGPSVLELFACSDMAEALADISLFFLMAHRDLGEFMDYLEANFVSYQLESETEAGKVCRPPRGP